MRGGGRVLEGLRDIATRVYWKWPHWDKLIHTREGEGADGG